ncbi:MAG: arylsulfatase [Planctomycetaceae bacterium]|jgi:arylsulfatase A-like enzyme|nr:arylsulfatase [Planctomycetaceae bacterium]
MMSRQKVWVAASLLLVLTVVSARAATPPNIVLIMADDMGYGDPQCYNRKSKIPTPHIDRLARQGVRFTDAHSPAAVCVPTRYGLLTGRYPFRSLRSERTESRIEPDRVTLGGLLGKQGYRTACVGKWHQGFAGGKSREDYSKPIPQGPLDRGFDRFFGIPASLDIPPYYWIRDDRCVTPPTARAMDNFSRNWTRIQGAFWRAGPVPPDFRFEDVLPMVERAAVGFIDQWSPMSKESPFFLYVPLPAPHTPWLPSKKFQGKSGASMYGDFVMMVDETVGTIIDALDRNKINRRTLVIFTSDNGPVWYPHDAKRFGHSATGGLRGMKGDAWEGGHRMPLIVRWPGQVPARRVTDHLICHTDLLATLAEITGADIPDGAGEDSISQWAVWQKPNRRHPARRTLVSQSSGRVLAVRDGKWKYIPQLGSGGFSKPRRSKPAAGQPDAQLYDLSRDPGEQNNLAATLPDVRARMDRLATRLSATPLR